AVDGTQMGLDHLLALCDSPSETVRQFGLSLLHQHGERFNTATALECLAEHSDASVQQYVAAQLAAQEVSRTFVKSFDQQILRNKHRSRKAKELVKSRLERNLKVDVNTLLEMARSQQKADAEWAVQQLVKLQIATDAADGNSLLELS
ncbi:MAG: hypothetical protein AAFO94_04195, partial [Bacteroidota bacterium]